ncbi:MULTISPECIES: alanine racemase [unclassified Janthinobacterium]|uniref:Alanine racemase n=1 Tax=Janthinobacterium lividum TaxID=29581 RepID=A0A1E8PM44_9BURK|nr:alanine racemase [Janthinobacterium sp. CG_23.4]MDH6158711.1 alanine racemase [Janthinobacterium sp. CG_23.4]OFJ47393.1 alanine racemase [Janthinobacterium lividum]
MPRPLIATIHLDAMQQNLARARACARGAKVWAVVKANAYGHGLERAMRGFADADGLALVELDYAVRLRELGWTKPILLLEGFFDASDLPVMAQYQLNGSVHCEEQIALLAAARLPHAIDVHLKMNTGMNRLGFTPHTVAAAYARLRAMAHIGTITLITHFANADAAAATRLPLAQQMSRFEAGVASIATVSMGTVLPRSLCNSAAMLLHHLDSDWVRPGIMLYGATPGGAAAQALGLLPTMTLRSSIIGIQDIDAGAVVGYGSGYEAAGKTRVGVVACGYADGYPRHAPDGTPVLVDGVRTGLIGRVSMDMLMVDLTHVPGARVGSSVTLWGQGMPIDEVAMAAGTIGYELMCALAPRVPVNEA